MADNIIGIEKRKVKALITAAGKGRRFGAITRATNKCLFNVKSESLIRHILKRFREMGIHKIVVVTGYQTRRVESHVKPIAQTIYNPFYEVSGILGSFWAARHELKRHPFVFTTSDHYFKPKVLKDCCRSNAHIRIVVQKKKTYTKEDAKVIIREPHIISLSKNLPVKEAHGEFGGMVYFSARASRLFFDELETHFEYHGLHGYMMDVLMKISQKHSIPILYSLCEEEDRTEVDSVADLLQARSMAAKADKTK